MLGSNKTYYHKDDILSLAQNLAEDVRVNEKISITLSGLYVNGELGFPLRIFKKESEKREGEPKHFDEAYSKAKQILDSKNLAIYEQYGFVWFSPDKK